MRIYAGVALKPARVESVGIIPWRTVGVGIMGENRLVPGIPKLSMGAIRKLQLKKESG